MINNLVAGGLVIRPIEEKDLRSLWEISYGTKADGLWQEYDGPYFKNPSLTWQEYMTGFGANSINNPHRRLISYHGDIIGMVSAYWEDGDLRQWLEFGIALFRAEDWNKGLGKRVLRLWIPYLFELHPEVQRVGYTTWSGNHGMMRLGEKLGLTLEAQIRKVRYTKGAYYDSIKYGILREERLM